MEERNIHFNLRKQQYKNAKTGVVVKPKTDPAILMQIFDSRLPGRKFAYSTKRFISKDQWSKTKGKKYGFPMNTTALAPLRAHLKELMNTASNWLQSRADYLTLDRDELRAVLDKVGKDELREKAAIIERQTQFFEIWENIIATAKNPKTGKPVSKGTKTQKTQSLFLFKTFCASKNFKPTLQNIDLTVYHAFDQFMQEKKNLAPNSRGKHMKELKAFFHECLERDYEVNRSFQKKAFKVIKEDVEDVYLTKEDIQALVQLETTLDSNKGGLCAQFIVACFTGLRYSDWWQHDPAHIVTHNGKEMFKVMQQKTGQEIFIPLHPIVKKYLTKYGRLPLVSNQKMNRHVENFCRDAKFQDENKYNECSCHTARRTFCTLAYLSKSIATQTIMKISGHKSEASFLKYLKLNQLDHALIAADSNFFTEDWTQGLKVVA